VLFQKENVPRFTNVLQNVPKPYGIWHRILLIGEKKTEYPDHFCRKPHKKQNWLGIMFIPRVTPEN